MAVQTLRTNYFLWLEILEIFIKIKSKWFRQSEIVLARPFSEKTQGVAIALALLASLACKKLRFCNISIITKDICLKLKLEYVFIIQRAIHTIEGDNSKRIFFFLEKLLNLTLFTL